MGCCLSRQPSTPTPNNPYPPTSTSAAAPDSSSRNITAPTPVPATTPRGSHASGIQPAVVVAPNAPLKHIPPTLRSKLPNILSSPSTHTPRSPSTRSFPTSRSSQPQWSRSRLEKERQDWWDTRINGDAEIWGAARMICELVQKGEIKEAQALLDATGCTCPSGEVWRGIYDERGVWYQVEEWVVVEPEGTSSDSDTEDDVDPGRRDVDGVSSVQDNDGGKEEDEESGRERGVQINVRCRISNPVKDYVVRMGRDDKVSVLRSRLESLPELKPHLFRLFVLGKPLDDGLTLAQNSSRWDDRTVINVMVFDQT